MNLEKLFAVAAGVVTAAAVCGRIDVLQSWIWKAEAKIVWESRTSTWGSPRFFGDPQQTPVVSHEHHATNHKRK